MFAFLLLYNILLSCGFKFSFTENFFLQKNELKDLFLSKNKTRKTLILLFSRKTFKKVNFSLHRNEYQTNPTGQKKVLTPLSTCHFSRLILVFYRPTILIYIDKKFFY